MTDIFEKIALEKAPKKPYYPPAIIHELELETRAGSPGGTVEPIIPGEDELIQP